MENFNSDETEFRIDTALLSPFLTFEAKPVPTGLCPLTPALLPSSSVLPLQLDNSFQSLSQSNSQSSLGNAFLSGSMLSPAATPVLGPLTPGHFLSLSSVEPSSDDIKSKFYSLFPNHKRSNSTAIVNQEYKENYKLSHKEAEQRRRDEFKEKLQNLKGVLGVKKHATKVQIVEMAKETILEQQNSIREYEEMIKVLLAERGL